MTLGWALATMSDRVERALAASTFASSKLQSQSISTTASRYHTNASCAGSVGTSGSVHLARQPASRSIASAEHSPLPSFVLAVVHDDGYAWHPSTCCRDDRPSLVEHSRNLIISKDIVSLLFAMNFSFQCFKNPICLRTVCVFQSNAWMKIREDNTATQRNASGQRWRQRKNITCKQESKRKKSGNIRHNTTCKSGSLSVQTQRWRKRNVKTCRTNSETNFNRMRRQGQAQEQGKGK